MIEIKIKVLEKVFDYYGVTVVMRRQKIERTWWLLPGKILSSKDITIWTTTETDLVRRTDFNPPYDWLVVNSAFRHYEKDHLEIGIKCVLNDKPLLAVAKKVLTI